MILGVHNLPYLGAGADSALEAFNLPPAVGSRLPKWAQHMPLPLGLLAADRIVTVSPTYSREILTPEFGSGLHQFLRTRSDRISGILNGIDMERWNPETDSALVANFNQEELTARAANKAALQKEFDLQADDRIPLLAIISRLDPQKGIDLVPDALRQIRRMAWQAIILGTGSPELEEAVRRLEGEFPDRVRAAIRFDGILSRRMYAGADALMIPSRYEPCGLTQMIAMRYGCVPVARATGGLRDTILDYQESPESTGFLFKKASSPALAGALRRALKVYNDRDAWSSLQKRGMSQDFSWERSAREYLKLYQSIVKIGAED
jgi:starch synthase